MAWTNIEGKSSEALSLESLADTFGVAEQVEDMGMLKTFPILAKVIEHWEILSRDIPIWLKKASWCVLVTTFGTLGQKNASQHSPHGKHLGEAHLHGQEH